MKKTTSVLGKIMPVILGTLLGAVSTQTAIADHRPNHTTNPNSVPQMISAAFSNDCTSVTASSDKDLSNVVLLFGDGTWEKFDDLDVPAGDFAGTGDNLDKVIDSAYIKSGSFKQSVDFTDSDSGKMKMIKVGETFTCSSTSLS